MWHIKYLCGRPFVKVMKANGIHMPQFKGFMVDNAQVNWNVVWIVFTHLEIHPNQCPINNELAFSIWFNLWRSTPLNLFGCLIWGQNTWKFATTIRIPKHFDETNAKFEVLRSWWHSFSIVIGIHLEKINHWLAFWHFWIH
jgi:hypothetical protein